MTDMKMKKKGFTIVELLIVIVVISILATISIVLYNGIQQRADDSAREHDSGQFKRLVELRNVDTSNYICTTCTSATQIATAYKASAIIPAKSETYMWESIYASPPVFDKKKIVIIHDDLNYNWMSVSYWSNALNQWVVTTYGDYGEDNPTVTTVNASSPMPPD